MSGLFAKGISLLRGDKASPEQFVKIAKVSSLTGPGITVKFVDGTTHDDGSNFDDPIAVQISAGDVSFGLNFDPSEASHAPNGGLYDQAQNLEPRNFQLRFPPSDTLKTRANFSAYVASHPISIRYGRLDQSDGHTQDRRRDRLGYLHSVAAAGAGRNRAHPF
jgi:hypothetical protein